MRHVFPYKQVAPVEIPDAQLSGVYSIGAEAAAQRSLADMVASALAAPIGSAPLRSRVKPGQRVVIVVDDNTRTTRTDVMLPAIVAELLSAGLAPEDVQVFVALGTHRPMTPVEMQQKYTAALVARHQFIQPELHNAEQYQRVSAAGNVEIRIHRQLLEADFVIGIGQTVPHLIAGFGGGCKIVNPGCADPGTIGRMHWLCSTVPDGQLFAVRDHAVRAIIDEVGIKSGLKFIINEVPGKDDAVAAVFAGDPIAAHRQACRFARASCAVKIRELADIVVSDSYPSDMDFWQALKGVNAGCAAVKKGGTVVFVAPCPEGVSGQHGELLEIGFSRSTADIEAMVKAKRLCPIVAAAIWLGSRLVAHANIILVSAGITEAEARRMGLDYAPTAAAGLAKALARHGPSARINVLYKAAKMICEV